MKLWDRLTVLFRNKYAALIFFTVVFFLTRFLFLGTDEINPDGVNWHYRSQQFIVGLKSGDFERTYQHYHPGVTLMWITGVPIEIYKQITGYTTYDQYNFLGFNTVAKISVVLAQLVLTFILLYYLSKVAGFKTAYLSVFLFSLEPFFLGNSRLYHMDVLLALFMFIALLVSWLNLKEFSYKRSVLAGIFLSLSFLTKSIGIGTLLIFFHNTRSLYFNNFYSLPGAMGETGLLLVGNIRRVRKGRYKKRSRANSVRGDHAGWGNFILPFGNAYENNTVLNRRANPMFHEMFRFYICARKKYPF
ncbi:MAG: hypothetical protein UV89_C0029G0005 [candidate division WWE3 bacterium GW2011_GWB2_43_22]|uniref:Glycosyltransferase RgtA/B/C/D-like domain-containing protein n=1 Tax=candidate division WWE3 bacterium GW2011_GWB2_43_22 TaxID=1619118 RepID=A0A0G1EIZ8_UNCKA|nr:MAG: hypothetical protein UV89_C0029G0005 [candidate division WWE3 bacterium GW2011_GWB2_43_22]